MRVATAMKGVHLVLHAPQGDTYADLLFTMIERRQQRPPVTFTTFQARDLGSDTAELLKTSIREAYERFQPELLLVGASCTAELIQDDPGGIARALKLPVPVVPLELSAYQHQENWGAAETFYQIVRACAAPAIERPADRKKTCNILGPTALGFRHRDDLVEIERLLGRLGVGINVIAPLAPALRTWRGSGTRTSTWCSTRGWPTAPRGFWPRPTSSPPSPPYPSGSARPETSCARSPA